MDITVIICTALGSAGAFSLIQFLITRHDAKKGALAEIKKEIAEMKRAREEDKATDSRRRILAASDEVLLGVRHSQEWWSQIMEDITDYEKYCALHSGYANQKARVAIKELSTCYEGLRDKHDFLV